MAKLQDDELLSILQGLEDDSSEYTFGSLRTQRDRAVKDYFQRPYGNEEDGWSQFVTSDVQDTIEWILPELLDIFVSSEDAVVFDPTRASDAEGAEQATDACNHVFYKQNNGFLVLYTLFKDALQIKTGAVHWRKETRRTRRVENVPPFPAETEDAAAELLTMLLDQAGEDAELVEDSLVGEPQVVPGPLDPATGQPTPMQVMLWRAKISVPEEQRVIRVEAFEPETLQVWRDWTSPLLDDCPYVSRSMEVSLSDLREMGFGPDKVKAEDLAASDQPGNGIDEANRRVRTGDSDSTLMNDRQGVDADDESRTMGWLRIEWVLADRDGDGIAERLQVYRLEDKILSCEECTQVPIAIGSPILVQHRWDGMSVAETVADLQKLRTELMRQVVNNANLANNPRRTVLTDTNGAPLADVDDLLDGRPGVLLRTKRADALGMEVTPFVGNQMFPMMEYLDHMREARTGVSKNQQGLDPNALRPDRTAQEVVLTANAAKQRIKLIARIFAETLVKPIFKGILKLLTEGDMERIAFRLRGSFVEYDPNEWRDSYDMTVNVGLGTGDRQSQLVFLNNLIQGQMQIAASPLGPMMVKPEQMYKARKKLLDLQGFKNVDDYWLDPGEAKLPVPPPPPPPPQVLVKQIELQAEAQRFEAESAVDFQKAQMEDARKQRELEAQDEVQRRNDERDAAFAEAQAVRDHEYRMAQLMESARKTDADNLTRIRVAVINQSGTSPEEEGAVDVNTDTGEVTPKPDPMAVALAAIERMTMQNNAPKEVVRDPQTGAIIGVRPVPVQPDPGTLPA